MVQPCGVCRGVQQGRYPFYFQERDGNKSVEEPAAMRCRRFSFCLVSTAFFFNLILPHGKIKLYKGKIRLYQKERLHRSYHHEIGQPVCEEHGGFPDHGKKLKEKGIKVYFEKKDFYTGKVPKNAVIWAFFGTFWCLDGV